MATALAFLSAAAAAALLAIILLPAFNSQWSPLKWRRIYADMVVLNATIYTSDDSHPFAEAMAVRDGRILRVGDYSSVKDLVGHETQKLMLNGNVVLPGFLDSHVHMIFGGLQMAQVELRGVNNQDDFVRKVKDCLKDKVPGEWILGGGWNNDLWGGELPTASWIDNFTPSNPVWLSRMDGHMGLANSYALKIAGILNTTHHPVGGTILKSIEGEPTGVLVDSAMKLVLSVIPEVSIRERRDALIRASKNALMRGVTTVVDFGRYFTGTSVDHVWQDFSDVYQWADSSGLMLIRVCLFFPMQTLSKLVVLLQEKGRRFSQWIQLGGVKAFSDGSLGSNSALFYEIEHAQHLSPGSATRFGQQRIIASVQPDHLLDDADSAEKKIGIRASQGSYLFQSLLAGDAQLAFGSDWPVADINPLSSIKTAMFRVPPGWENAWIPSERISLNDALKASTISAAYACFLDQELGSLSMGKYADFVVLPVTSWDQFAKDLPSAVLATYVSGKQAYP